MVKSTRLSEGSVMELLELIPDPDIPVVSIVELQSDSNDHSNLFRLSGNDCFQRRYKRIVVEEWGRRC